MGGGGGGGGGGTVLKSIFIPQRCGSEGEARRG